MKGTWYTAQSKNIQSNIVNLKSSENKNIKRDEQ